VVGVEGVVEAEGGAVEEVEAGRGGRQKGER
jgi:hypothetical protein